MQHLTRRLMLLLLPAVLAACSSSLPIPPLDVQDSESAAFGERRDPAAEVEALAALDRFVTAFNNRDMAAWEATLHFPHFHLAGGNLTVLQRRGSQPTDLFDRLVASGWHHSDWYERRIVQSSPGKVHVAVILTRFRGDGTVIARYPSLYVVTREGNAWGIKGRSSYAP